MRAGSLQGMQVAHCTEALWRKNVKLKLKKSILHFQYQLYVRFDHYYFVGTYV